MQMPMFNILSLTSFIAPIASSLIIEPRELEADLLVTLDNGLIAKLTIPYQGIREIPKEEDVGAVLGLLLLERIAFDAFDWGNDAGDKPEDYSKEDRQRHIDFYNTKRPPHHAQMKLN